MAVQVFSIMLFTLLNEGLTNAPLVFLAASDNLIKEDKEVDILLKMLRIKQICTLIFYVGWVSTKHITTVLGFIAPKG